MKNTFLFKKWRRMDLTRKFKIYPFILLLLVAVLVSNSNNIHAAESALIYPGGDGELVYVEHANIEESNKDNIIPDFSYCGYMEQSLFPLEAAMQKYRFPHCQFPNI